MIHEPSTFEPLEVSEMELQNQREVILELKKAKEDRQYTIQRMLDEILMNGDSVSETTLKRVFRPGSEDDSKTFNMEHTLLPIRRVLIKPESVQAPEDPYHTNEIGLLKAELRIQAERVENLRDRNMILEKRVDFMQRQIEIKDRRLDEREDVLRKVMAERDALRARLEDMS